MKAIWNNTVIAESNDTVVVENNHYFPADSIKREFFEDSIAHTYLPLERPGQLLFAARER